MATFRRDRWLLAGATSDELTQLEYAFDVATPIAQQASNDLMEAVSTGMITTQLLADRAAGLYGLYGGGGVSSSGGSVIIVEGGDSVLDRQFPIAYNTPSLSRGALIGYTPSTGDEWLDVWVEVDTAWNGLTPRLDFGTLFPFGVGLLSAHSLAPFNMRTADITTDNDFQAALTAPQSWSAALANGALAAATPVPRTQMKVVAADPIRVVVSQDGFAGTPVAATLLADGAPSSPLSVVTGTNDRFVFNGTDPANGGGGAAAETFTMAAGNYTTAAAVVAAMAAATGSVSGERFDSICTPSNSSGFVKLTMNTAGGAANGNSLNPDPSRDVSVGLGFTSGTPFAQGHGGDPGATQGSATLHILTSTPQ